MTDLDKLIEAVEAGDYDGVSDCKWRIVGAVPFHIADAYQGSLDAAKALHEELLDSGFHAELWESCTRPRAMVRRVDEEYMSWSDNTARAWLLSILKAYRAQK